MKTIRISALMDEHIAQCKAQAPKFKEPDGGPLVNPSDDPEDLWDPIRAPLGVVQERYRLTPEQLAHLKSLQLPTPSESGRRGVIRYALSPE